MLNQFQLNLFFKQSIVNILFLFYNVKTKLKCISHFIDRNMFRQNTYFWVTAFAITGPNTLKFIIQTLLDHKPKICIFIG